MILDSISFDAYTQMVEVGLIKDSEQELVDILLDQEVVTYCNEKYSVTFDVCDLVEE